MENRLDLTIPFEEYNHVPGKWVNDGCEYPENLHIDNQMPACASCNINKHSMPLEQFRELIAGFMKHLNNISTQYKIAKRYGLITETEKPVVFYFETVQKSNFDSSSPVGIVPVGVDLQHQVIRNDD